MFKYMISSIVYYLKDNKINSASILSRMIIENVPGFNAHTVEQKKFFNRFGKDCIKYATCHGEFFEDQLFASKDELKNAI